MNDFCALSALELNNGMLLLYRKATQVFARLARSFVLLFQSLEVVVEHSRMADQAHLFACFDVTRSNDGATPRADNIKCRLQVFEFIGLRIYVSTHANCPNKLRSNS